MSTKLPGNYLVIDEISRVILGMHLQITQLGYFKQNKSTSTIEAEKEDFSHSLFVQDANLGNRTNITRDFRFIFLDSGEMEVYRNESKEVLKHGDLIAIPGLSLYHERYVTDELISYYYIDFSFSLPADEITFRKLFDMDNITVFPEAIPEYAWENAKKATEACVQGTPGYYFQAYVFFQRALGYIQQVKMVGRDLSLNESPKYRSQEKIIYTCVDYVDHHPFELVNIGKLCELCDCSQSYLYQCFSKVTGFSSKEFLMRYKMRQVESDLINSSLSIEEVAKKYGFSSIYSFSAVFKKMYNISPNKFRQVYRSED